MTACGDVKGLCERSIAWVPKGDEYNAEDDGDEDGDDDVEVHTLRGARSYGAISND